MPTNNLSICCVTRCEPFSHRFLLGMKNLADSLEAEFIIGADAGCEEKAKEYSDKVIPVKSKGYIESILQEVLDACTGEYIFRLDDDELVSSELFKWFHETKFSAEVYSFRRLELYQDEYHYISHPSVHPNVNPRMTTKALAVCKDIIHGHFTDGYGTVVEAPILHYKFLLKSYEERLELANKYESIAPQAGLGSYKVWTLPEDVEGVIGTLKRIEE